MELSSPKKEVERKERKERKGPYEALSREGQPSTVTECISSGKCRAANPTKLKPEPEGNSKSSMLTQKDLDNRPY